MGADPGSMALMAAIMGGSSLLGGITAPQGQQLQSFEGIPGADPAEMFGETKGLLDDYLSALVSDAAKPVHLNTTVAPLPAFKGGALPMTIAAPAMDPNRFSPSLRDTPGFSMTKRTLTPVDSTAPRQGVPGGGKPPGSGLTDQDGNPRSAYDPRPPYHPPTAGTRTLPPHVTLTADDGSSTGGEGEAGTEQAQAAAELLASLTGGGGGDGISSMDVAEVPAVNGLMKRKLAA